VIETDASGEIPQQYALTSAMPVIKPRRQPVVSKRDWAHVVDVNKELANFRELVPNMAREVMLFCFMNLGFS
jgi:antiviral helicase SKI2